MLNDARRLFPRLLEEKINALLDTAEPTPAKAFQLYKACKSEELWQDSFEKFAQHLNHFFNLPKVERKKSALDAFLERPLHMSLFESFQLNFHNALVDNRSVLNIANWAHHLMRVTYKINSQIISEDVLTKTLHYITHPPVFEKSQDIKFDDFCEAWKKIVFRLFGKKYDSEFTRIVNELKWLERQQAEEDASAEPAGFLPTIYLTQTEIDWTSAVEEAVRTNNPVPKFPLSRGPQKIRLMELERTIRLYQIVQTSQLPEFIRHRENIRVTILDRCARLLRECAR